MPKVRDFRKAKDFKGSIKKLFAYLKPYLVPLIISVLLVILSTICTLVGPNRLSEITKVIEKGISVNLDLSAEEFNKLETEKTCELVYDDMHIRFGLFEDDKYLRVDLTGIGLITKDIDYQQLKQTGYIELEGMNMGLSYDESLHLWVNTNTKINMDIIFKICVFLVILYISAYIFNFSQGFIMATLNQKVSKDLRTNITQKISKLPLKYFDTTTYVNVLSIMTNDVDTI